MLNMVCALAVCTREPTPDATCVENDRWFTDTLEFSCSTDALIASFCRDRLPTSDQNWYDTACAEIKGHAMKRCREQTEDYRKHPFPVSLAKSDTIASPIRLPIELKIPTALIHKPAEVTLGDGSTFKISTPFAAAKVCRETMLSKSDCSKLLASIDLDNKVRWNSVDLVSMQYEDNPRAHTDRMLGFASHLVGNQYPFLEAHMKYVSQKRLGFVAPACHWMWKLLVDEMPSTFHFLEIGVFKGSGT